MAAIARKFRVSNVPMMAVAKRSFASTVTTEIAKQLPKTYNEMPNEILLTMAIMGDQDAKEERLIREIMAVDSVDWVEARKKFDEIVVTNRKGLFLFTLPYKVGILAALTLGLGTIPFIYHLETVMWFNEEFVTSDVPEDKDLETPLEVSSWAWNWMEPSMGAASFTLLCMQYARNQLQNLDAKPYTQMMLHRRANRVIAQYPQYNAQVIREFSEGDSLSPGN